VLTEKQRHQLLAAEHHTRKCLKQDQATNREKTMQEVNLTNHNQALMEGLLSNLQRKENGGTAPRTRAQRTKQTALLLLVSEEQH
jgi:hypothetical protein